MELAEQFGENWKEVQENARKAAIGCGRKPEEIKIIAVSKTHPFEYVEAGLAAGIRYFGENYAQELRDKSKYATENNIEIPEWHYIGHLQSNKVKYVAPVAAMIHSVDSVKLAKEINKQAAKHDRTIDILLQVNSSGEDSKSGCEPDDVFDIAKETLEMENLKIRGLMTIGSFSYDEDVYRAEFRLMKKLRNQLADKHGNEIFEHLSMGMTHDYEHAIEEGATIVRVGTAIFGQRNYNK